MYEFIYFKTKLYLLVKAAHNIAWNKLFSAHYTLQNTHDIRFFTLSKCLKLIDKSDENKLLYIRIRSEYFVSSNQSNSSPYLHFIYITFYSMG